ncbi:PRTRC system protein C [Herbaspirillum camelliae]|uniref:PRTRC system protein C n=1 Tax=Herbaspirillum camelliae TaxID=1892903 RepID=UPI000949FBEE|nr:PRTRC system protein C [Herbaspirillum camelliae]
MQTEELIREFKYGSVKLADPSSSFSLTQVREFYANHYPELLNADIEGPEMTGNRQIYTFRRAVGTKGLDKHKALRLLQEKGTLAGATSNSVVTSARPNTLIALALQEVLRAPLRGDAFTPSSHSMSVLP